MSDINYKVPEAGLIHLQNRLSAWVFQELKAQLTRAVVLLWCGLLLVLMSVSALSTLCRRNKVRI